MNKAALRAVSLGSIALAALFVASSDVGATSPLIPAPHFIEPHDRNLVRVAGLFGESDEEKAARLQHEADQDGQIKALNDKVHDLEDSVRSLTGQNEELNHRLAELNEKIDRQQRDFEARLCALAAQQLGTPAGANDPNAIPCPTVAGAAAPPAAAAPAPVQGAPQASNDETPPPRGRPPGVLGTLPAGNTPAAAPAAGPGPSSDAIRAQYTSAMGLLAKARYDEASAAFRTFADTYPKDDLASQAIYWVGDIAYVQKDYDTAMHAFAEVIKKYPTSLRAPDSMLKLGQALIAAGQKKEGCTALAALPAKYPKAPKGLLAEGADARKTVCHGIS